MKKIIPHLLLLSIMACSGGGESENSGQHQQADQQANKTGPEQGAVDEAPFQLVLFRNPDSTIGYEIGKGGKILIRQPHIPAVPGNRGFATEKDVRKVAGLMVDKIRQNIMPPTISVRELDSLKISY